MAKIKKEAVSEKSASVEKSSVIDNHDDFNSALLDLQSNIDQDKYPHLEVSEQLFMALSRGRKLDSMTYGHPGVRIFKEGTSDDILEYESVSAEKHREREIWKISEAANK